MIMNEKRRVETLMELGDFSSSSYSEVGLIVRYLINEKKITIREDIVNEVKKILSDKMSDYLEWEWDDRIEKIVANEIKNQTPLSNIDSVPIMEEDIIEIRELKNSYQRKLLFTLLMYARLFSLKKGEDREWIGSKQEEIFKSANLDKLSVVNQDYVVADLIELGKISYDFKVDGLGIKVNHLHNNGKKILSLTSFENLGNFIEDYINITYNGHKVCTVCKKTYKPKAKDYSSMYCEKCKKIKEKEKTKERVRKIREKQKM